MSSRSPFLLLVLIFALLLAACATDESKEEENTPAPDGETDDDTTAPPFDEPWDNPTTRPIVHITSPQPGAILPAAAVPVSGSVSGLPVEQVLINGAATAVNDQGQFTTTLSFAADDPVLPIYVSAESDDGVFGADRAVAVHGELRPPEEAVADAAFFALGDEAFTVLGALLSQTFTGLDLTPFFEPLNPIIDIGGVTLSVTTATIGGAELAGELTADGLQFTGALTDLVLETKLKIGILPESTSTITISKVGVSMLADITLIDGTATASLKNVDLFFEDVVIEPALPDFIVNLALGAIEGIVEFALESLVPPALEDLLPALSLDTVVLGFDLELALTTLDMGLGAMSVGLDLNLFLTDLASDMPWPNGSLATPGDPPAIVTGRPPVATTFGLGWALSDDLVNRLLWVVADTGLLATSIGPEGVVSDGIALPLTAGTLALFFPGLSNIDPATPASMNLMPMMPPLALPGEDGRMTLRFPDYRVELYLHPPDRAPWLALTISADLAFAIDAEVTPDGALKLLFPAAGFTLNYLDNPLGDDASLPSALADWLTQALAPLLELIFSSLPIELPPVFGVQATPLWWGTAGPNFDFWTAYWGLAYTPPAAL